jgi:superfamily II DNA/RNA helicase
LAFQIAKDYERFSKYMPTIRVAVFFGGVSVTSDEKILATNPPHIVIGTPGRILALLRSRKFSLKTVKHFILDECDQMLEQQETRHEVEEIFQSAQSDYHKQVMVFATSLSKDTRLICKRYLQNPVEAYVDVVAKLRVQDDQAKVTLRGRQAYQVKLKDNERKRLHEMLDVLEFNQIVILVKSVHRLTALTQTLVENNFPPYLSIVR